jgi:hypothetical protein
MSTVLWISLETDPEDFAPDDLGYLFNSLDTLDAQCSQLKVRPLSQFVDDSDLEYNMSEVDLGEKWLQENAKWSNASELLVTLRVLEKALIESENDEDILEEIRYVAHRCAEAEKHNTRVRLISVM